MIEVGWWIASALAVTPALYLGCLALLARAPRADLHGTSTPFFSVVVPAHNESAGIGATVASLRALDYPTGRFEVVVVADNCSDDTAARARAAGADVIERHDPERRGKGYALELAFASLTARADVVGVAVVDADTVVSRNLLRAFAARLERGERAMQAEYGVRNVEDSWRTRLMTVALAMFHRTRSLARERLGVSAGLRGNGMGFSAAVLRQHPHRAYGLVEDVEYGLALGRVGVRVAYVWEAEVLGEMVAAGRAAVSQRQRWEAGRAALVRSALMPLVRSVLRRPSLLGVDLLADLLVPPLATVALITAVGVAIESGVWWSRGSVTAASWLWASAGAALALYLGRGIQHSGLGLWRALGALAHAPVYVAWKLVAVRPWARKAAPWVRTERVSESAPEPSTRDADRAPPP